MITEEQLDDGMDRRAFLRAALATAGAGAAALLSRDPESAIFVPPTGPPAPLPAAAAAGQGQSSNLLARLAALQAENARLQAQLGSAEGQLSAAQAATGQESAEADGWRAQLDGANGRINVLSAQVGAFAGLVALYDQLEGVDLDAVADSGIAAVGGALGALVDGLPIVSQGLQAGELALGELEAGLPILEQGREWLQLHLGKLGGFYAAAESALIEAVEDAGAFLQLVAAWFQKILGWLPFGIGDSAAVVVAALSDLLGETPNTVGGLQNFVLAPLDGWLAPEGDETPLQRKVIKPVREQALAPAGQAVASAETLNLAYQNDLLAPFKDAAGRRQLVRDQIAAYRQQHAI
ncbi:MAG: hypothetical protein ACRDHL_02320 [Candidatus Promineifilaceae bacterium]